jgi:hypothetical protein
MVINQVFKLFTIHHLLFTAFLLPSRPAIASPATAATAPITTASATATAAIAAIATTTTTTTAAATAAVFAWSGFVDGQVATTQVGAIKLFDCFFAVFFGSHFDKTEPA